MSHDNLLPKTGLVNNQISVHVPPVSARAWPNLPAGGHTTSGKRCYCSEGMLCDEDGDTQKGSAWTLRYVFASDEARTWSDRMRLATARSEMPVMPTTTQAIFTAKFWPRWFLVPKMTLLATSIEFQTGMMKP